MLALGTKQNKKRMTDKIKETNELEQLMLPSPAKVTTVPSISKKNYDNSFTKNTFQIHQTIIPFLTVMIKSKFSATKKLYFLWHPLTTTP
jgi:hypothetical protein